MKPRDGQERGDRPVLRVETPVGENDKTDARGDSLAALATEFVHRRAQRLLVSFYGVENGNRLGLDAV